MRKKINFDLPEVFKPKDEDIVTKSYEFEVITPIFGGDVESWKINPKEPVRSQAVKGQLRFWWRAMQNESDHSKLLEAENKIWGGKSGKLLKSSVQIAIIINKPKTHMQRINANRNRNGLGDNILSNYVLFPVTQQIKNNDIIQLVDKCEFTLLITYKKVYEQDVLNTLELWTLLGGVGARTRRGCGSLYCKELLSGIQTEEGLCELIKKYSNANRNVMNYPRLANSKLYISKGNKVDIKALLDNYGRFRQQRNLGNNNRPGRSHWPEPDAIRRTTNKNSNQHRPVHPDGVWFPRAAFGLPIITKFNTADDPSYGSSIELKPKEKDRWPSPIIIKIIKLGDGSSISIILALSHKFPDQLCLGDNNLPITANPENIKGKLMIVNSARPENSLNGRSIYGALADYLDLREIL